MAGERLSRRAGNVAERFEDLQMYQKARELTNAVYAATRGEAFSGDWGLVNQVRRSCVSVMSNMAEGFERGTKAEFMQFLYIAKGSCGEVRAQLQVAVDQRYISEEQYEALVGNCRHISSMISRFVAHQHRSRYEGEKATAKTRWAGGSR